MAAFGLIAVALTAGLGGAKKSDPEGAAPPPARDSAAAAAKSRPATWLISGEDLAILRDSNAGVVRRYFNNPDTFVIGAVDGRQDQVPAGFRSIAALAYTSLARFSADVGAGAISPRIDAIVYDPESWGKTPLAERQDPLAAMRRFTKLASEWGYGPILAPGRDLTLEGSARCTKQSGEILDQAYLRCGLIDRSLGAETFVVQAAPEELDLEALRALLDRGAARLGAGARSMSVASLSTVPPGADEEVWPIDLVRAAHAELARTGGVMLNLTPATAPLAASFLRDLEGEPPPPGLLLPSDAGAGRSVVEQPQE